MEPLAAESVVCELYLNLENLETGITDTAAPVSTRNFKLLSVSNAKRRRDDFLQFPLFVVAITELFSLNSVH